MQSTIKPIKALQYQLQRIRAQEDISVQLFNVPSDSEQSWFFIKRILPKLSEQNNKLTNNQQFQTKIKKMRQNNKAVCVLNMKTQLLLENSSKIEEKEIQKLNNQISDLINIRVYLPQVALSIQRSSNLIEVVGFRAQFLNEWQGKVFQNSEQYPSLAKNISKTFHPCQILKNTNKIINLKFLDIEIVTKITQLKNPKIINRNIEEQTKPNSCLSFTFCNSKQFQSNFAKKLIQLKNDISLVKQNENNYILSRIPRKLSNPHQSVKTINKEKYLEYYIQGVYQYYHYGDQSFNDQGWGCAYRSFQSLLSWFYLQYYIDLDQMPSLTKIQEMIDNINLTSKDKIKNTCEWIGATQVSWLIKKITGFDCRILHVSDGKDILQNLEMFRQHFQKNGCPIMYGGGQYAYSIVGINYSMKLGECQFMILDPHYCGQDNISKIIEKKGVVWRKPQEMFKKGIFYNFCLPIIN